jgi:4,5:9,10-diseco-3-hydroxy-5,9,17-trioxoandrosta-1(10),2-diene-4-oate hydrolase
VEERRVRVGPFEIRTLIASRSGGPAVVLLHGFGAWADVVWGPTIEALASEYTVVAPDLIGFGRSTKPSRDHYDVPDPTVPIARVTAAFLDALGIGRATLVGNSLGGGVALRMALQDPARVERLVLVDSMGLGREIHPMYKMIATPVLGRHLVKPDRRRLRRVWEQLVRDRSLVTDALIEENYRLLSEPGATDVLLAARHGVGLWGQRILFLDELATIACPTLLVWGREDGVFPLRHGERAMARLPNATMAVLDGCGHVPPLENPPAFTRIVRRWLRGDPVPEASKATATAAMEGSHDFDRAVGSGDVTA